MPTSVHDADAGALLSLAIDPDGSRLSHDDEATLEQLVAGAASSAWFNAFKPSRDVLDLKQGNALARVILEARAEGEDGDAALARSCLIARDDPWACARDLARDLVALHDAALQDLTRRAHAGLITALAERIEPVLIDADTSRPRDAFGSCDRAEVLFVLSPTGKHALDASITSHRPWPEFGELCVTEDLVHALAAMGYTLGQYRKASGNAHVSQVLCGRCRMARPDFARRRVPLCSWDDLREVVDNACSTNFLFVLYAMVPITQLLDIDPARAMTFSRAAVATWDPWNGTFHDAVSVPAVTVTPKMGTLMSAAGWHSPDSICGFVHSYYHADLSQADTTAP